ncbi:MAG: peptidoglycan-binding domain-containing protein [Scytonema sp. PMC 1069.18]|nr:peptidoglycan-binding domain-containing protein [Scytonema sp. PMC 1069.18]MEC4887508.1 peptidoglycan-binding domain-containing protein [Scytonema sp. PMC 1070.18]
MSGIPATLSRGSTGADVERLQRDLAQLGYNVGSVDGMFGEQTENAVKEFQTANSLSSDGVVGPQTGRALGAALA